MLFGPFHPLTRVGPLLRCREINKALCGFLDHLKCHQYQKFFQDTGSQHDPNVKGSSGHSEVYHLVVPPLVFLDPPTFLIFFTASSPLSPFFPVSLVVLSMSIYFICFI